MFRHMRSEGVDVLLQHRLEGVLGQIAVRVEGVADATEVDFRLLENRTGNARQDVLLMLGRADACLLYTSDAADE